MSKDKYIRVLFKAPGKAPEWRTISNDLKTFQRLVKGYIEAVAWDDKYLLIVNEDGKRKQLDYNFLWIENRDAIVGPCFWVALTGEDFASIIDDDFKKRIEDYLWMNLDEDEDILEYGLDLDDLFRELIERNGTL